MVTIPNDNRTLMDQHRPYPKRATSRSPSLPLKGKKTKPVDLITNDDVKQRVLSCFEDAVFIRCTYMSFHYKRKYSRHLDTEESDLPLLFGDKLRVMDFGQTQKYFYLATELTVQYARALPSDISSQRHSDFQIIRKRLFRLCSSPVKKYVLRSMYLYVYGAEPKFPLLHQENSGPALRFNDWSGLLNALPLMPLKSIKRMRKEELSPLWYDEADEMAPQVQIIHKRPVKERKSSKRTITVQPGHDAPKPPHTHTPLTPFTQLYYSSVNETDACRRGVVTSYSDENCPKPLCLQPPLIKAPKQFHHAIEPTSPWPLKPQTVRNFALPQPQSVQYQSHPPLSIVQPALPSRNQSLTLAQPTGEIVSSLHLTRLRIIKLFEDVMYVSVQDLSLHHYLKYGVKLDSKIVSAIWLANFLPLTLCQINFGFSPTFALRQSHAPPPAPHPLPVETLHMRVLRLIQCRLEPKHLLWLYERAYGPLHHQQFPVFTAGGTEIVAWDWPEFISWTRARGSEEGCRALYATEGEEYKKVPLVLGQKMDEGWTVFVGSEGKICAEELLRKGEERIVVPPKYADMNVSRVDKKMVDEKKVSAQKGMVEMVAEMEVETEMEVEAETKVKVEKEKRVETEVKMVTEEKAEIVTESLVSQAMLRIPPNIITPAQQRMLDVMFFVNWKMPKSRLIK